jgi:hypothetical protein
MKKIIKKITTGNAEVLDYGAVILYDNSPFSISFGEENGVELKLSFKFKTSSESKPTIETEDVENNTLNLTLVNFDNPLGTGTINPIPIGTWHNKKLSLSFKVYSLSGSEQKSFEFTFYQHD